ncbi:hypothetical protein ACFC1I_09805 [Microbacterium sp. NPDC056044]|uniref:hypothetical protein n=1 Tax=Microbacterium sp. NPDC056044 TaxID=3345690 RepID=UPI0035D8B737
MSDPLTPSDPAAPATSADPATPAAPADPATPAAPAAPAANDAPGAAPAPQPYRAPDLDAPRYAVPAYAAPGPGDVEPEPVAHGAPRRYAAPSGYAVPGTASHGAGQTLPPYARDAAAPISGAPGTAPYPATGGTASAAPAAPYPVPGVRAVRPKGVAITALVLAGVGVIVLLVGAGLASSGAGWLSPLLLFAAFVLSLVALISKNQGGKGFGAGALILSLLGGLLSVVVAVAWIFGSWSGSSGDDADPGTRDGSYDDYTAPGITAPGTDGQPDPGVEFAPPVQLTVAETAFGQDYGDMWWYVVVVDNPNADYVFDAFLDAQAFADDGALLGSGTTYTTVLSGRTAIIGYVTVEGGRVIDRIDVRVPEASTATLAPATETGSFTVEAVTGAPDGGAGTSTDTSPGTVTGSVRGRFADDQRNVAVTVIARDAGGGIVAVSTAYLETVPGDGTPVPFEAWFAELPADATFEAFAHR